MLVVNLHLGTGSDLENLMIQSDVMQTDDKRIYVDMPRVSKNKKIKIDSFSC